MTAGPACAATLLAVLMFARTAPTAELALLSQGLPAGSYTCDRAPAKDECGAQKAFDGATGTAWVEGPAYPSWLMVDLGKNCRVIKTMWYPERSSVWQSYTIEISDDGKSWRSFADQTANRDPSEDPAYTDMGMVEGRYVRITLLDVPDPKDWYWPVIQEFQVYGLAVAAAAHDGKDRHEGR
jgi:hypothetical protein